MEDNPKPRTTDPNRLAFAQVLRDAADTLESDEMLAGVLVLVTEGNTVSGGHVEGRMWMPLAAIGALETEKGKIIAQINAGRAASEPAEQPEAPAGEVN